MGGSEIIIDDCLYHIFNSGGVPCHSKNPTQHTNQQLFSIMRRWNQKGKSDVFITTFQYCTNPILFLPWLIYWYNKHVFQCYCFMWEIRRKIIFPFLNVSLHFKSTLLCYFAASFTSLCFQFDPPILICNSTSFVM